MTNELIQPHIMQLSSGNELLQVNTNADTTTVHCVLTPQFSMHALAVTSEVFRKANARSGQNLYHINLCSFDGEMVSSDSAWPVTAADPPRDLGRGDRILVFAAETSQNYQNPNLLSWLRMQFRRGADIAGIDVGTFILARCGILDGIEATAHWRHLPSLRERFPKIIVTEKMFCSKGRLATSAGGQGTIDLMLNIVSQTHGASLARDVAAALLFHKVNGPDTPQRPRSRTDTNQLPPQIRAAVYLIEENISSPLTVPEIASRVGLSQRHLERTFRSQTGYSVVKFGLLTRLDHACALLRSTGLNVLEVATACGFSSVSHFSTAFRKHYDMAPSRFRARSSVRAENGM